MSENMTEKRRVQTEEHGRGPRQPASPAVPAVVCSVCGYSPGRRIPDRCPVCLSHRDHFRRV
jgi:rubrerythrin